MMFGLLVEVSELVAAVVRFQAKRDLVSLGCVDGVFVATVPGDSGEGFVYGVSVGTLRGFFGGAR